MKQRLLWLFAPWLAITGCVADETPGLEGTWELASVDSSPIAAAPETKLPYFTIAGQTIEGFDGCNSFGGPIDGSGAISATKRACPDLELGLPMDLNDLDKHLQDAQVEENTLTVPARGAYPASTYVRKA